MRKGASTYPRAGALVSQRGLATNLCRLCGFLLTNSELISESELNLPMSEDTCVEDKRQPGGIFGNLEADLTP